jgi:PAS domain S-box-containing protein
MHAVESPPAVGTGSASVQRARGVALYAAVVAVYVAAAHIGFRFAFAAEQVSTVWAPTGIALATLLLWGSRLWPAIWIGALVANATSAAPFWTAFLIATGNTLEALVAVRLLARVPGFTVTLGRVTDVLRFLGVSTFACTPVSATIGVAALSVAGAQPWGRFPELWFDWWFGDVLGAVLVAPAILTVARHRWSRSDVRQAVLFVAAALVVTHVVFGQLLAPRAHPLEYAIFPLVIGAAVRGGLAVTSLAVLGSSIVAVWHTARGVGPFAGQELHESLILLQVFMGVLGSTALLLGSAVAERRASERRARDAAATLRLAQHAGGIATFFWDVRRQQAECSPEFFRMFGVPTRDGIITAAEWDRYVHPDDRDRMAAHLARALDGIELASADYRIQTPDGSTRWVSYAGQLHRTPDGDRLIGTIVDITDRKRLETDLRHHATEVAEANRELGRRVLEQQTLFDVLPIGIGIALDRECRHIRINRAFGQTLGLAPDVNASKTAGDAERPTNFRVFTPEGVEVPGDELPMQIAAREGREVRDVELDIVHEDGRVVRLLECAAPLLDEHGVPRGAVGAFVDVTAAHHAQVTLARSEERYRQIFATAGVSLWEEDFSAVMAALDRLRDEGIDDLDEYVRLHPEFVDHCVTLVRVVDVNPATLRMFGASDKAALIESLSRIFRPETRPVFMGELLALVHGQRLFEAEAIVQALDGRRLDVLVSIMFPGPGESLDRVLVSLSDITARKQAELGLRQEVEVRTTLAEVGASLAGELRSDRLVQAVTDASTELTEAEFGAFSYDVTDAGGEARSLYALSGVSKEALSRSADLAGMAAFGPTFREDRIMRSDDVTTDSRYGQPPPLHGLSVGHLPVRSFLAVPVVGRDGVVHGRLFFGHSKPGVFTERHEALASGVAGWAAIALDNARLYQDAEQANRLKDEFLATLSHELRTPLNAVLGWACMLREGILDPATQVRALESLERNARAQAQLVDDLLDVSRIMAGKLQIRTDAVDLGTVVTHAVDTVRAGVTAKRLRMQVHIPAERRFVVTGDPDRLQQVVWNLVSNAVKFTPAGGRVDVELRQVDSRAEIVVRDTGQGIDPLFRPHLFQRFRQSDPSRTRVHGGLGIGLSIVRHLVEAHGGTVHADSEGPGHGAVFRVLLPLRSVNGGAALSG